MDEIRGFAVFCMVFFHAFYTLAALYQSELGLFWLKFFSPAEPWFAGAFIFISGVSSDLSHSNLARGAKLLVVALGVTLVTGLIVPEEIITFGILHFLAVCMLLYGLYQKLRQKRGGARQVSLLPVLVPALLFLVTYRLPQGFLGVGSLGVSLPSQLYQPYLAPFGLPGPGFASADYFPLLPWIFVFLAGTVCGRLAAEEKLPAFCYKSWAPPLSFLGRHALIIYIVHQPVIYGLTWLLQQFVPVP